MAAFLSRLKSVLWWSLKWVLVPLFILFLIGEQCEIGRLGAVAACEGSEKKAVCIRTRGYLAEAPWYPDLTRRYLADLARFMGRHMGASYVERESEATPNE